MLDEAAEAVADARKRRDRAGEARARGGLGAALLDARRTTEGRFLCRQAVQLADELGDRTARDQALTALGLPEEELDDWSSRDDPWKEFVLGPAAETTWFSSSAEARRAELTGSVAQQPYRGTELFVELAGGFVVLKFLGPFAEAFATTLGGRLGESTARAIGRLRLLWNHADDRRELDVVLPAGDRTTVVLPDELTDAARSALIELDVTAVRGTELHWDPVAGTWRTTP